MRLVWLTAYGAIAGIVTALIAERVGGAHPHDVRTFMLGEMVGAFVMYVGLLVILWARRRR